MVSFAGKPRGIDHRQTAGSTSSFVVGIAVPLLLEERPTSTGQLFSTGSFESAGSVSAVDISKQARPPAASKSAEPALNVLTAAADAIYADSTRATGMSTKSMPETDLLSSEAVNRHPVVNDNEAEDGSVATSDEFSQQSTRLSLGDIVDGAVNLSARHLSCILPQIALVARNITRMELSHNRLTQLPDEIGHLRQLQHIDISHNQLEVLPGTIAYWQCLCALKAGSNRLTDIPMSIRHIPQLSTADLSANRLESVPAGLWSMCSLNMLDLSHNPIRTLPARIFAPDGAAAQNSTKQGVLVLTDCPIGEGFTDIIDKPSTVFTSRFKYAVVTRDPDSLIVPNRRKVPTLVDIIACKLANSNAAYPHRLPEHIQARLGKLMICDHCHKLYPAATGTKRWRLVYRNKTVWPIEYNFCSPHWSTEKERIATMFAPRELECLQPYYTAKRLAEKLTPAKLTRVVCDQQHLPLESPTKRAVRRLFRTDRTETSGLASSTSIWEAFEDDVPDLPCLKHVLL